MTYFKRWKLRQTLMAYLFLIVPIVIMIVFIYYPILFGVRLSFFKYDMLGNVKFLGFKNYIKLFHSKYFWNAFKNSLIYLGVVPPLQLLSIFLAVLINNQIKGRNFFRLLFFIPVITPISIAALIWRWIFRERGILNFILSSMGLINQPIAFLTNPKITLFSIMFVTLWKGLGYYMMIYLAGLQGIPEDFIDAAKIDGAKKHTIFFKIIIPLLKPYVFFCSTMSAIAALNVFGEVYAMTGGGPNRASETMALFVYKNAFEYLKFGYSSAAAVIFSIVVFIFTIINFRIFREGGVKSYF